MLQLTSRRKGIRAGLWEGRSLLLFGYSCFQAPGQQIPILATATPYSSFEQPQEVPEHPCPALDDQQKELLHPYRHLSAVRQTQMHQKILSAGPVRLQHRDCAVLVS